MTSAPATSSARCRGRCSARSTGGGVELYYNVQVTPWMNLTPDFQIVQPGARAIADTAYIAGVRLNFKF
ncbi:MAG: carbohydrate porin [Gemmataceae bacterium]